jgi:NAD(P)-dependent dehydrogenase (short-subunit alcohol dehydrogenase family)
MTPVWFVTGRSTGRGRTLATAVLDRGWRAEVRALLETNFHGLVAVTKAVLPALRRGGPGTS